MKITLVLTAVLATASLACSRDVRTNNPAAAAANRAELTTLTGCLVSGDQPNMFMLSTGPETDHIYMIESERPTELSGLVNTRVAVNGYVEHIPSVAANGSDASAPIGTSGSGTQVLRAESVRKIDDRCAGASAR